MSIGYVLAATRAQLWDANGWDRTKCDVLDEPPATAGQFFICISEQSTESTERSSLREVFHLQVAVWIRTGNVPKDRKGDALIENTINLGQYESQVKTAIHGNHQLRLRANEMARAGAIGGDIFQCPLWYQGADKATDAMSTFELAKGIDKTWMRRNLRFAGANRVQNLAVMK